MSDTSVVDDAAITRARQEAEREEKSNAGQPAPSPDAVHLLRRGSRASDSPDDTVLVESPMDEKLNERYVLLKPAMVDVLHAQARAEFMSMSAYLAASFWFAQREYEGIASYLMQEAWDEKDHAMEIFDYLHKKDAKTVMPDVGAPKQDWQTAVDVFEHIYHAEVTVEKHIDDIFRTARKDGDFATEKFLDHFVTRQVEEVDKVRKLLAQVKSYARFPGLLWHLDHQLGKRTKTK